MKALIKVGYACNENCSFCHTADVRHIDGSAEETHAKIERAAQLGHTMVVFSGGEATIRPELFDWAAHANRLGLDVGLVTNGLMLAYPDFLERLLALRLRYVYMSLHGGTEKIHNLLVRANTFQAAQKALAACAGKGLDFSINCVVTRQNVEHLRPVVDLVAPYPDVVLKFSMVQPKGNGEHLFRHVSPRVTDAAARIVDAIHYGWEKTGGPSSRFRHDGVPFCHLPGLEHLYDDLKTHRYWTMIEVGEPDFFPVDDRNKVQPAPCGPCALRGACPGLFVGYEEAYGQSELKPVSDRERSNSWNYTLEKLVTTDAADGFCPIKAEDSCTPWDRGRHLFVKNGPRIARFRAETRDFADVELDHVKHDLGQVYLDVSRKVAPDDFRRDLVQLRRSGLCSGCAFEKPCTGLFEPVFEDVFGRDDEKLRTLVAGLEGDVLDVGCGEGPYDELLRPLAESGRIRYVGIDPEPARIAGLQQRWPWARLEVATAESFVEGAPRFDHVLVLRSWNHLKDPASACAGLLRALRPGGTLTVVDNTAFGLARTQAQSNRAETSDSRLEHYRNDTATEAHAVLAPLGFALVERHDVGPGTSNQWLLRYRAP